MAYVTLAQLKAYADIAAAVDDTLLTNAIESAVSYIEATTNRKFDGASEAATTRYFDETAIDWRNGQILNFDTDLLSVTTLLNADAPQTPILPAEYWLLDRNLGPPYRAVQLLSEGSWIFDVDVWVELDGVWAYSTTVPHDVRQAALALSEYLYRQRDSQTFDVTAITQSGEMIIPQGIPATVDRIIQKYRRRI